VLFLHFSIPWVSSFVWFAFSAEKGNAVQFERQDIPQFFLGRNDRYLPSGLSGRPQE